MSINGFRAILTSQFTWLMGWPQDTATRTINFRGNHYSCVVILSVTSQTHIVNLLSKCHIMSHIYSNLICNHDNMPKPAEPQSSFWSDIFLSNNFTLFFASCPSYITVRRVSICITTRCCMSGMCSWRRCKYVNIELLQRKRAILSFYQTTACPALNLHFYLLIMWIMGMLNTNFNFARQIWHLQQCHPA